MTRDAAGTLQDPANGGAQPQQQLYQPPQSAQKNTNLIVRIDNSSSANHQITKRKRLKDGAVGTTAMRNGQSNAGEPSDTDQMSEAGQSLKPFAVDQID